MHVADEYRSAGMHDEADLFESCSDPAHFFTAGHDPLPDQAVAVVACSSDPDHFNKVICPSCQLRTCPDCAHREGARLLERYMPELRKHVERPRAGFRFRKIVLTTPISVHNDDLSAQIKQAYKQVRKLFENMLKTVRNGRYAISDVGVIVAHEFGPNGLKLHFHALYYGPYLAQADLVDEWESLTGWRVVWIEKVGAGERLDSLEAAVVETLKYTTKFWKRQKNGDVVYIEPRLVPIIHKALEGSRRVRSWGLFYNIQVDDEPACCETCGALLARFSPLEFDIWQQTGWLPDEFRDVLRSELGGDLNLKLGNKSPPARAPAEYKQEKLL